jgi:hypothetical protein
VSPCSSSSSPEFHVFSLALLALAAFRWFRPEAHHEVRGKGGLVVDVVTSRVTYRQTDPIPLVLTWPTTKTLDAGCASPPHVAIPPQRDAVELWFHGNTIDVDGTRHPYLWHSTVRDAPRQIELAPHDRRIVARSQFTPLANRIEGTLCVRACGFALSAGSYETARR